MPKYGVIQHEEVLQEVLESESVFFIPCVDKADAHSKAVSLNNAKKRLPEFQQRKLRVQRAEDDGIWGVRVFPATKIVVWKIVNGEKVQWNPNENKLSEEGQRMLVLMIKDRLSLEEIVANLSDEKRDVVKKAYEKLIGEKEVA